MPKPRGSRKLQVRRDLFARNGVGDGVRFLERTKTRVGSVEELRNGKLHKWRIRKAKGALWEYGTEGVYAINDDLR